jgi:hypothetical protein
MTILVDTSSFPVGHNLDYVSSEEVEGLAALEREARLHVESRPWAPAIERTILAFGLAPIVGLFLVRFVEALKGELEGETEMWVVVGDLPPIVMDTEMTPTPALALRLYCAIAEDWAENVLSGGDLLESYPITTEPTPEHALMLKSRIDTLRADFIPLAV